MNLEDINKLHTRDRLQKIEEAIKIAINSGVDMSMIPYDYEQFCRFLTELVKEGKVSLKELMMQFEDFKTKVRSRLFDNPITDFNSYKDFGSKHNELAYKKLLRSITLLKNKNDILPLKKNPSILITGPNANTIEV